MLKFFLQSVKILTWVSIGVVLAAVAVPSWGADRSVFYSVFVEAFATGEAAAKRVYTLKSKGYDAFVRHRSMSAERKAYRVYLGRFSDQTAARDHIQKLVAGNVSGRHMIVKLTNSAPEKASSQYPVPLNASFISANAAVPAAPSENATASDSPAENAPGPDATTENTTASDTPDEDTAMPDSAAEIAPVSDAPAEPTAVPAVTTENTTVSDAPSENTAMPDSSAEIAPVSDAPAELTAMPDVTTENTTASDTPAEEGDDKIENAPAYYLHVGSFLNYRDLTNEIQRFKQYDLDPFWIKAFDHGLSWFRIYLGSYSSLVAARAAGDQFIRRGIIPLYTVDNTHSIKAPQTAVDKKKAENAASAPTPPSHPSPLPAADDSAQEMGDSSAQTSEVEGADESGASFQAKGGGLLADIFDKYGFSIGIRLNQQILPDIETFAITQSDAALTRKWFIDSKYNLGIALPVSMQLNEFLRIEGSPEFSRAGSLSSVMLSLRPKLKYPLPNGMEPFVACGVVYGKFDWKDAPGDFDAAVGWDAGVGLGYLRNRFRFSTEAAYRNIQFRYNPPEDASVVPSRDQIDFSGYSISLTLEYLL